MDLAAPSARSVFFRIILISGMGEEPLGEAEHPNICRRVQKPVFGEKLVQFIRETLE